VTIKDPDEHKVGRALADAVVELALSSVPGFFIPGSAPSAGSPYGVYSPALVPSNLVPQYVTVLGGERTVIDSVAPATATHIDANHGSHVEAPGGATTLVPLGQLFGARSGDKGGNANLGIFARSDEAYAWLDGFLSVEELRRLLPKYDLLSSNDFASPPYGRSISSFTVCSMRVSQPLRVKTPKRRASANGYAVATVEIPTALLT